MRRSLNLRPVLFAAALAAFLTPALAQKTAPVKPNGPAVFSQVAEVEREITGPDGQKMRQREPAAKVPPGEVVIYTSRIQNTGRQPLTDLKVDAPIPQHTRLVDGSVFGEVTAGYSVDGGKRFAPLAELKVTENGKTRPATVADVTTLRLRPRAALPAGNTLEMGYRVTVQ